MKQLIAWAYARAAAARADDGGYSTEAAVVTALVVIGTVGLGGVIVAAISAWGAEIPTP